MNPPVFSTTEFMTFLLILIRVSIILFLAPIFGSLIIPPQVKAALALVLSLVLTTVLRVDVSGFPVDLFSFIPLLLSEIFLGLSLTLLVKLVLEGAQIAGQYLGFQMGFAIVNVVDPQTGNQASVLSQFAYVLALIVFLSLNGHYLIIKGLVESFEMVPPGQAVFSSGVFTRVSAAVSGMFVIAVKIAAPAVAVLFFTKVAMGIVAKTVPQMNVLFVGMPLYIVIGLFVFGLSLNFFVPILSRAIAGLDGSFLGLLRAL